MSTGVKVNPEVIEKFEAFKLRKSGDKYVIFKIVNGSIVFDQSGTSDSFDDFLATLPADDCRYAVYDMHFETKDGRPNDKVVFVSWSPETAKVRSKMTYAGSKEALSSAFQGISVKINATDLSELTIPILTEACRKF